MKKYTKHAKNFSIRGNEQRDHVVAANIKHAVGTADQLTDDLSLCRNESQTPVSSQIPRSPVSPISPTSPTTNFLPLPSSGSHPGGGSELSAASSTSSFNSGAMLAKERRASGGISCIDGGGRWNVNQASVLSDLPNYERYNDETVCYSKNDKTPSDHRNIKEKKYTKRFDIMNIGKNVAKLVLFFLILFIRVGFNF